MNEYDESNGLGFSFDDVVEAVADTAEELRIGEADVPADVPGGLE